jgi:hypothetical protein
VAVAINLHHLFTIPQSGIHRFVGSVSEPTMRAVRKALLHALAFEQEGSPRDYSVESARTGWMREALRAGR